MNREIDIKNREQAVNICRLATKTPYEVWLSAGNALVNAGADVMGMVAIFSYGFNTARKAFEAANVELTTLSNYDALIDVASETGYIRSEDIDVLKEWRFSPSTWGKNE